MTDQDGNKEGASDIDVSSEINREEKRASFSASAPAEAEEKLRSELQKKEQAARESHDRYLRTLADFENYKKRAQKEQMEQAKFANEKLIKEFLPVIDNLDRALAHSKETKDFEKMVEGVELIQKQLLSTLAKFGVRPIESLNQPFDPFLHQSIGQVESDRSDEKEDQVVGETQKGYFLNERVLRPSLVLVSKKKSPSGDGNGPSEK